MLSRATAIRQLQFTLKSQISATSRRGFISTAAMSSISDVIIKDHRELETYYNEVLNTSDHDHQERYGNQFVWELARHSVGEELVVYPAFEKYLGPTGKMRADKDREEHHRVHDQMTH